MWNYFNITPKMSIVKYYRSPGNKSDPLSITAPVSLPAAQQAFQP